MTRGPASPACTCKVPNPTCKLSPTAHTSMRSMRAILADLALLRAAEVILADARAAVARSAEAWTLTDEIRQRIARSHYEKLADAGLLHATEGVDALRDLGGWRVGS